MKLYYSKGACSLSIRIVAHELGIKLDHEAVDLASKKTKSGADFWSINPKGSVPALELDDGSVLTENIAIQLYLADTHPSSLLPPIGDFNRYRVIEWLSFAATDLHKSFSPLFNSSVPQEIKNSVFMPLLEKKLDTLNKALSGKPFLMGEVFTLPDAYCFVCLRWLKYFQKDLSAFPALQQYVDRIAARPTVEAAIKEE